MIKQEVKCIEVIIRGLVQGIGFRPFIYKLAHDNGLRGTVENRTYAVHIMVEGKPEQLDLFLASISEKKPSASQIESIDIQNSEVHGFDSFTIVASQDTGQQITEVSPDLAVCDDCLEDMKTQPHRMDYAFTNCTNCGPRFSIIRDLPYDRGKTTMDIFSMCPKCEAEYSDVHDRRFHAQPVACNDCGPKYTLLEFRSSQSPIHFDSIEDILRRARKLLSSDAVVAVKGLGGFHLFCNAKSNQAVTALRELKKRDAKPFALLAKNTEAAKRYVEISEEERELLESWRRPIVLLKEKTDSGLSDNLSQGLDSQGIMLASMPFHHLLFEDFDLDILVATSGNISDEPIVIDNERALSTFSKTCQAILLYNREIHNRVDDSLCFVTNKKPRIIRRSRGYAPGSLGLNFPAEGILAVGAELKNTFCFGRDNRAFLSQHIGDLKNLETNEFFEESIERQKNLFRLNPKLIAHDLHPDYLSSKYAKSFDLPGIAIQHHWAHITSVMAEHGIDEKVIGFAFDGTGLGSDGTIWGGEVLICDFHDFSRVKYLENVPLPGGDKAVKETWRMALSYLYHCFGEDLFSLKIPFLDDIEEDKIETIITLIDKGINSPLCSSMGRFFDAIAAILGISSLSRFEAEAAMLLESKARLAYKNFQREDFHTHFESNTYGLAMANENTIDGKIKVRPIVEGIIKDIHAQLSPEEIALKFHCTIAKGMVTIAEELRTQFHIDTVALGGGVFYNRILLELSEQSLTKAGFKVLSPLKVPAGDGGIALGQLAIAAHHQDYLSLD